MGGKHVLCSVENATPYFAVMQTYIACLQQAQSISYTHAGTISMRYRVSHAMCELALHGNSVGGNQTRVEQAPGRPFLGDAPFPRGRPFLS